MKKYSSILMTLCLMWGVMTPVHADHLDGKEGWTVTYTKGGKLESNFNEEMRDAVEGLQPGDDITLTVTLNSKNKDETDWYMSNEAVKSLEDGSVASGGAYTYELVYTAPDGTENILYTNRIVGGEDKADDGDGLHEATEGLKDYVYLGKITNGQTGTVTLNVALDGDTQGNSYRSTSADLNMKFAVEVQPKPETPENKTVVNNVIVVSQKKRRVVNTGDPGLIPYYIMFAGSSLMFVLCLIVLLKTRQKKEENA